MSATGKSTAQPIFETEFLEEYGKNLIKFYSRPDSDIIPKHGSRGAQNILTLP